MTNLSKYLAWHRSGKELRRLNISKINSESPLVENSALRDYKLIGVVEDNRKLLKIWK